MFANLDLTFNNLDKRLQMLIHLILMRIRILDPDPGHVFKIYWIFFTKNNFQNFCFIFFAYFYPKTWWTIQKWGNFYNLLFFQKFRFGV